MCFAYSFNLELVKWCSACIKLYKNTMFERLQICHIKIIGLMFKKYCSSFWRSLQNPNEFYWSTFDTMSLVLPPNFGGFNDRFMDSISILWRRKKLNALLLRVILSLSILIQYPKPWYCYKQPFFHITERNPNRWDRHYIIQSFSYIQLLENYC